MAQISKLKVLTIAEYNLIANKDPVGSYDRRTRENLDAIRARLRDNVARLSDLERRLHDKFKDAKFQALDKKDRQVRSEVNRHRLSARTRRMLAWSGSALAVTVLGLGFVYALVLDAATQKRVDYLIYERLGQLGMASPQEVKQIKGELDKLERDLVQTKKKNLELAQMIDQMIQNNKVPQNLQVIVKRIHDDPRAKYVKQGESTRLLFDGKPIAQYSTHAENWYILGILETGMLKVFYNDEEILEVPAIFGRKDEETPVGEYEIENKLYKPTWYKKEEVNGRTVVRAIPFGDPDHEIGHWWLGMKRLGKPVPGSYGIHGVNVARTNEFFKKNYDHRGGSAGCPNIQEWNLDFLAHVLPTGTPVHIVHEEKWSKSA
ncbi:L,D-transpeptidase family protein [Nitrospina watsonii]|uniref:YkuD domain-containing protein n=1 Tax=Nitrospina watsonii TaxID=1323948 RepID=A0ABM9HI28_9BACT|nr:L,D-transpeptidase family protein [Nitrospina watsonii]CAI2719718.1 YkuD domain-containing protein [Nitrospina watsonii]